MDVKYLKDFPLPTLKFLEDLEQHNEKAWFEDHRSNYEEQFLKPAQAFVEKIGKEIHAYNPNFLAIPKIDKSIFRIYRDVRFSKNKQPYKTHLGIFFWEGSGKKLESSGLYFHAEPTNIMIALGMHMFSKEQIAKYRQIMSDDKKALELRALFDTIEEKGYRLGGKTYKKVPRGFDKNYAHADLLLYSGVYAFMEEPPTKLDNHDWIKKTIHLFKDLLPLHDWLISNIY